MSGNTYRNEVSVTLNGTTYVLRPSFAVIEAIETKTGQSIYVVAAHVGAGLVKVTDAFVILKAAVKAAGASVSDEDLKRDMSEGGLHEVAVAMNAFIVAALNNGDAIKKAEE